MTIDTEHFRSLLLEERERVQQAIQGLRDDHPDSLGGESDELSTADDNHMGDLATATLDREIDYSLEDNSGHILREIDAALKRIDDGTYGICTNRGEQIPIERLEAMPWASTCIDCARGAANA
jgi:RNA polymerase-binding transcription factor